MVKAIKDTIVKKIVLNMYFFIVITSLQRDDGITAGVLHRIEDLPCNYFTAIPPVLSINFFVFVSIALFVRANL